MHKQKQWFVIINPKAGGGKGYKKWPKIQSVLNDYDFNFDYTFTKHHGHSKNLVKNAINKGYRYFICIGGDGTLHHLVNGILSQEKVETSKIKVGVIPIGTGNDWIKTYAIPKNINKAVSIIKKGVVECQDVGKIDFINSKKPPTYFINLAGIGFDGYVAKKAENLKLLGSFSYLFAAIKGLFFFKNFSVNIVSSSEKYIFTTVI